MTRRRPYRLEESNQVYMSRQSSYATTIPEFKCRYIYQAMCPACSNEGWILCVALFFINQGLSLLLWGFVTFPSKVGDQQVLDRGQNDCLYADSRSSKQQPPPPLSDGVISYSTQTPPTVAPHPTRIPPPQATHATFIIAKKIKSSYLARNH